MLTKLTKGGLLPRRSFCAKTNCFRANGNRGTPRKRVMSPKTLRSLYIYIFGFMCVLDVLLIKKHSLTCTLYNMYIYISMCYPEMVPHMCAHTSSDMADLGLYYVLYMVLLSSLLYGSVILLTIFAYRMYVC